jgi:dipeptidyl aminopeptidase/acylaminoacyl peptidase
MRNIRREAATTAEAASRPFRIAAAPGIALLLVVGAALGGSAAGGAAPAAARRPIAETDLFHFVWVGDPQISPDGKRVAFVRSTVDARREGYETAIWIAAADPAHPAAVAPPGGATADAGPRPLTAGPRDSAPRWSPDGRRLAFVRQVGQMGKEKERQQLFVLPLDGGEAHRVTDLPGGASSPAWSPDGRTLAFLSATSVADLARAQKKASRDAPAEAAPAAAGEAHGLSEHESDVRVITRAVFRANDTGYVDFMHPEHLWTVEVPPGGAEAPPPRQLTRGEFAEQAPAWAPDGSRLYYVSERDKEPSYREIGEAIYAVPAAGGEPLKVAGFHGGIASLAVSPDGRQIAFIGASDAKPARSYDQPNLWVVAAEPAALPGGRGEPRNLTADFDFDVGARLVGDQHPPRSNGRDVPIWSSGGRSLLVPVAARGRVDLRRFDAGGGRSEPVTSGDHEVVSYAATPDGARLALVVSTPLSIGDLFVLDIGEGGEREGGRGGGRGGGGGAGEAATRPARQLTNFNAPLFGGLVLTSPEAITYRSFDGREIEAWVQKPPDFEPGKRYPLILDIHGGPHGAYGYTFFHEAQWLAAKGYVVLCPNPRGSSAYGQEFGNVIQYHFPGDDYKDLMAGVDDLVRRGVADPKRLGVTGGSGGGLLTNWTITQTDRFAAAASQRSIADWAGWWYSADFTLFTPRWFRGAPFEDPQDFAARSPITYVRNVKTPLMVIEGEADYRTPPAAGGEEMFRALKYLHRPVVMVRFPGESHELSRSGRPWHRVERLQHIARWFDKYLKGEKTGLYDVP